MIKLGSGASIRAQKFFRYIWRANAVLILLAAAGAVIGLVALIAEESGPRFSDRNNAPSRVEVAPESKEDLILGHAEVVPGSTTLRAELFAPGAGGKGFSSGGRGSETRNILFVDPSRNAAHWLLPDNQHTIADKSDITGEKDQLTRRVIATVMLVEPRGQDEQPMGELILVDADGKRTTEISNDVSELHLATLDRDELIVVYEHAGHLILTAFDPGSLAKRREQNVEIPQLK